MKEMKYIWHQGKLVPWQEAKVHVLTHSLHYGGGAFEGIRVYQTDNGPAIFRLNEHIERLLYSAEQIAMSSPYSKDEIKQFIVDLIRQNEMNTGYIRPIFYYGYGTMGLNPSKNPVELSIACWPWAAYLPYEMVDIVISPYCRIHPKTSITDAKLSGHYLNSQLASLALRGTKYHEALLLDVDGNVAEGPGENIFTVKDGALFTPKLGNILPGITRDSMIQLSVDQGFQVHEVKLKVNDIYEADEAFFTGTAAEITPIRSLNDRIIGTGEKGTITSQLSETYQQLVHGNYPNFHHFLHYVEA